jgi:hypothetical protein
LLPRATDIDRDVQQASEVGRLLNLSVEQNGDAIPSQLSEERSRVQKSVLAAARATVERCLRAAFVVAGQQHYR